jgi:hypothetical protein
MHRGLLVADQDVLDPVLLEERVIERKDGAAGIAENNVNALIDQRFDNDLRSGDRFHRHDWLLRRKYLILMRVYLRTRNTR